MKRMNPIIAVIALAGSVGGQMLALRNNFLANLISSTNDIVSISETEHVISTVLPFVAAVILISVFWPSRALSCVGCGIVSALGLWLVLKPYSLIALVYGRNIEIPITAYPTACGAVLLAVTGILIVLWLVLKARNPLKTGLIIVASGLVLSFLLCEVFFIVLKMPMIGMACSRIISTVAVVLPLLIPFGTYKQPAGRTE